MKTNVLVFLAAVAAAGCSVNSASPAHTIRVSNDVVTSIVGNADSKALTEATATDDSLTDQTCMEHIKRVACVSLEKYSAFDPRCSADAVTVDMLAKIPEIVGQLPPLHRKVFCNIGRFQIQPAIESIAYAGQILNDENTKMVGVMVGVRADAIEGKKTNTALFSWKEQLNFGLSKMNDPNYVLSPKGPTVVEGISGSNLSLVLYVITHEVTHLIDFLNLANHTDYTHEGVTWVANELPDSFALLSWPAKYKIMETDGPTPEWVAMSPILSQFCFYSCTRTIPIENMKLTYDTLKNSSFMTSYSTSSQMEDFADSSTMYLLGPKGFEYKIVGPYGEALFSSDTAWVNPNLNAKKLWLKNFYARTDLKFRVEN